MGGEIFGVSSTAIVLAVCIALEPTLLGHGALIKSDVAAGFGALWFGYRAWKYWRENSTVNQLLFVFSIVLAALIKFSLLVLVPVGVLLALVRRRVLTALIIPFAVYLGIIAASQFQAQPVPQSEIDKFAGAGVPEAAIPLANAIARLPWPVQYVRGMVYIGLSNHNGGFTGYMLGKRISGWTPSYFPLAWAIKFPIPLQILTCVGLIAVLIRIWKRTARSEDALVWGLVALFALGAVFSRYHIGFRHLLPAIPLMILGAGFGIDLCLRSLAGRVCVAVLVAWLMTSAVRTYPQGIAYFNEWIGGPENGWRYLSDSNIDWGQNVAG